MRTIGLLMLFFVAASFTAKDKSKTETITIKTTAVCGECKERIEKGLNYTKGVVFAELDLETKEVTVKYNTKKISQAEVEKVISDMGYDAGSTERDEEAFKNLPGCCQAEGRCAGGK